MAQASRSKGKARSKSRSGNGVARAGRSRPGLQHRRGRPRARPAGGAVAHRPRPPGGPGRPGALHPHRRLPPAAHPGGPWLRDPGRGARNVAARRPLGRAGPRRGRAGRARGDRHAVPRRPRQDLRRERLSSGARRPGERNHRHLPGRPRPAALQRGRQAPAAARRLEPAAAGPRAGGGADPGARPAPAALHPGDPDRRRLDRRRSPAHPHPRLSPDHRRGGRRRRNRRRPGARCVGPGGGRALGQRTHHADAPASPTRPAADGAGRRRETVPHPRAPPARGDQAG